MALAEIVNGLRFLRQVKEFTMPPIDTCIKTHEDNEGAIKMVKARFSSRRTKRVDVKHHIIRDAIDERVGHVEYVRFGEQRADILT